MSAKPFLSKHRDMHDCSHRSVLAACTTLKSRHIYTWHTRVYTCEYVYTRVYICGHVYTRVNTCIHVYIYVCAVNACCFDYGPAQYGILFVFLFVCLIY